jgi:hypothetical protein
MQCPGGILLGLPEREDALLPADRQLACADQLWPVRVPIRSHLQGLTSNGHDRPIVAILDRGRFLSSQTELNLSSGHPVGADV